MAISIRSVISYMQNQYNPVERVAYALKEQNDSDLLEMLSQMSAKEILEFEHNSGTVLSTLVEALFSSTEVTNFFLEKTWEKIKGGICDGFIASASVEPVGFMESVRKTVQHLMDTSFRWSESSAKTRSGTDGGGVSPEVILLVAKGIKVIAQKLEDAFLIAQQKGPEALAEHNDVVTKYLQNSNVTYVFAGIEYKRNCVYATSLQYLFHASDPIKQKVLLEPLKELLLGFFRYPLDPCNARSLHYALSLSGGVHEDLFIDCVIKPLFDRAWDKGEMADDYMIDNEGNTLLHYALSSVCCSEKTVTMVVEKLGVRGLDAIGRDDLSLVEILVNNAPYYAMFFSLWDMSRVKERALDLSHANNDLKKAADDSNFSAMRLALRKRTDELYKIHIKAHEAYGQFGSILKLLCQEDEKVRKAEEYATLYDDDICWDFRVPGILSEYKELLQQVLNSSDAFTEEKDQLLVKCLSGIFDACDSRRKLIGASGAAAEVVRAVLQDPRYIRRFGVTAACSREYASVERGGRKAEGNADRLSSGWIYDPHSWGVNRFFGMMCIMCKWSACAFEDFCILHDLTREAMLVYRSEKRVCSKIIKVALGALWALSFGALVCSAVCIGCGCERKVLYAINAVVSLLAVGLVTSIIVCNKELVESERNIKALQDSFAEYVSVFWRKRAEENIEKSKDAGSVHSENTEKLQTEEIVAMTSNVQTSHEAPCTSLAFCQEETAQGEGSRVLT